MRPRGKPWPEGFALTPALRLYAEQHGVNADIEWPIFENKHRAQGSVFIDWTRAWYTWVLNEAKWHPRPRGPALVGKAPSAAALGVTVKPEALARLKARFGR